MTNDKTYEGKVITGTSIEAVNGRLQLHFADNTFATLTDEEAKEAGLFEEKEALLGDAGTAEEAAQAGGDGEGKDGEEGKDDGASSDASGEGDAPDTTNTGVGQVGLGPEANDGDELDGDEPEVTNEEETKTDA